MNESYVRLILFDKFVMQTGFDSTGMSKKLNAFGIKS